MPQHRVIIICDFHICTRKICVLPHNPGDEVTKGRAFRPDLQVTHLDTSGVRYLVDVTTVDVTAATNRGMASKKAGVAATKAEGGKTREYKSKVDGRKTQLIPAAFELCGRWGERLVMLFKKGIRRWNSTSTCSRPRGTPSTLKCRASEQAGALS